MAFVAVAPAHRTAPAAQNDRSAAKSADLPVGHRKPGRRIVGHIILAVIAVLSIFPVYWLFATALRRPEDATSAQPFPWPISFDNFTTVFDQLPVLSMFGQTFLMALVLSLGQLFIAILAAYSFAMFSFRGKKVLFFLFIGSWLVPFQVTMIPNYLLVSRIGLLNTVAGVVVPQLCSAFAVILLRQHMQAFPRDLVSAAQLDGRGSWGILWRVVLPNMRPALAALAIMLFITSWNEYLWPLLILRQNPMALVQVGVRSFLGAEGDNWGAVMAAAGMACIPILLIYIFLQRFVVDAFIRSGIK